MNRIAAPLQPDPRFQKAAQAILRAAREARAMPPLSGQYPQFSVEEAYHIQNLLSQARLQEGSSFAGYKIGLTSRSVQLACGLVEPIYGRILHEAVHAAGARLAASTFIKPHIELELAFIMGRDVIEPDVSLEGIMAATEFVVPALEIVDHRMESPRTISDTIADNSAFAAIVLSPRRFRPDEIDAGWAAATLSRNGLIEESGVSAVGMGHPGNCVAWLAETLRRKGESLRKGDIVMSGAFARSVAIAAGDDIHADFGPLGAIDVSFS